MRRLEAAAIAAVALQTLNYSGLVHLWPRSPHDPALTALALLTTLLQHVVEGTRWQLYPLYPALLLNLLPLALLHPPSPSPTPLPPYLPHLPPLLHPHLPPALHLPLARTAAVLAALLTALAALATALVPVFSLPPPTGPLRVATVDVDLSDPSRPEWFAPFDHNPSHPRRLVVRLTYPVPPSHTTPTPPARTPYMSHLPERAAAMGKQKNFPPFLVGHVAHVFSHALAYPPGTPPPPARNPSGLPLVIFSHGYGGTYDGHTAMLEELASHGYVAASVSHTMDAITTTFASTGETVSFNAVAPRDMIHDLKAIHDLRQRQLQVRVDDVAFVIKHLCAVSDSKTPPGEAPEADAATLKRLLAGTLDASRIAVVGHSFGGATAVQSLADIEGVRAAVGLDAWLFPLPDRIKQGGVAKPLLFLQADKFFIAKTPYGCDNNSEVEGVVAASNARHEAPGDADATAGLLWINGAGHGDFGDLSLFFPAVTRMFIKVANLDGVWMHRVMGLWVQGFLRAALAKEGAADQGVMRRALGRMADRSKAEFGAARLRLAFGASP